MPKGSRLKASEMPQEADRRQINKWQTLILIVLQLAFALCASSVLLYRFLGWAPDVIHFQWYSYRAFNIYISLSLIGPLIWLLGCHHRFALPLLVVFATFHLIDGVLVAFWLKATIQLLALALLALTAINQRGNAH